MHFLRPYWFLALIPLFFIILRICKQSSQSGAWKNVCDAHLLPHLLITTHKAVSTRCYLFIAIGCAMIVGLAGPSFKKVEQTVYQGLASQVIVLDLSKSMDTNDIKPSRLTRAKFKVIDLLTQKKQGKTALIVFAGEPYVVSPLTRDTNTIAAIVPVLTTALMPVPGHDIGAALTKAADLLLNNVRGQIILITDSKPDTKAINAANMLYKKGAQLHVLAVGTNEPAPTPSASGFVLDKQGAVVLNRLPIDALQSLATHGGGKMVRLSLDGSDIEKLRAWFEAQGRAEVSDDTISVWRDDGYWFALLAGLLMLPLCRSKHGGRV